MGPSFYGDVMTLAKAGTLFRPLPPTQAAKLTPGDLYTVNVDMMGYYLEPQPAQVLPSKYYGDTEQFTKLVLAYYEANKKGGLISSFFYGPPGSGKSIQAKHIAANSGLPIIQITSAYHGNDFYSILQQAGPACFLVDEFEKLFDQSRENPAMTFLLSLLDGTLPLPGSMFILTSNDSKLHAALIGRPSRIFFLRYYGGVPEELVLDYCREKGLSNEAIEDIVDLAIQRGDLFTFDMLMSIVRYQLWHNEYAKRYATAKEIGTYFNTGEAKSTTRASNWRTGIDLIIKSGARLTIQWTIKADSGFKLLKHPGSAFTNFNQCGLITLSHRVPVTNYNMTDSTVRGFCNVRGLYEDTINRLFSSLVTEAVNNMYSALRQSAPDTTPALSKEYEEYDCDWEMEDKIKMLPFLIRVKNITLMDRERIDALKFLGTWLMEVTGSNDISAILQEPYKEDAVWHVPFEAEPYTPEPTSTFRQYSF